MPLILAREDCPCGCEKATESKMQHFISGFLQVHFWLQEIQTYTANTWQRIWHINVQLRMERLVFVVIRRKRHGGM